MSLAVHDTSLVVRPEPEPPDREAIARALVEAARAPAAVDRGAWWHACVRENLAPPAEERRRS